MSLVAPRLLAQSDNEGYGEIFFWAMILVLVVIVMFVAVLWIKKWVAKEEEPSTAGTGFTLSDLRALHKTGKMSDEEFERAKAKMIAIAKAPPKKPENPKDVEGLSQ